MPVGRDTLMDLEDVVDAPTRVMLQQWGRRFSQGEILFREGEPAESVYLLH